jgi:hypothetical protein
MVLGTTENRRKQIAVGERVPLELSERERDLIMKHTFAGNNLTDRLRLVPIPSRRPSYRFTLDDLDELAGYVAAEANHAKVRKHEQKLRRLYARLAARGNSRSQRAKPLGANSTDTKTSRRAPATRCSASARAVVLRTLAFSKMTYYYHGLLAGVLASYTDEPAGSTRLTT